MKNKKNKAKKKGSGKKLIERAGLAIKHEFYIEAVWILSSLLERKMKKILEKMQPPVQLKGLTFSRLIKRIKHLHGSSRYPDLTAHFNVGLIDDIRTWKNQRNEMLKDIPDVHVSRTRLERLATEGIRLYKELSSEVKSFNSTLAEPGGENEAPV